MNRFVTSATLVFSLGVHIAHANPEALSPLPSWATPCTVVDENKICVAQNGDEAMDDDGPVALSGNGSTFAWHAETLYTLDHQSPKSSKPPSRPSGVVSKLSCTCTHPSYPCYASYNGQGPTCWSFNEAGCNSVSGSFCVRAPCTVSNCQTCEPDGATCTTCNSGYMGAQCQSESDFFADVTVQLLPESGIVALASANLHSQLAAGFAGTGNRGQAITYVTQAFLRAYKDVFSVVYVFPASQLSGSNTHQQYWGASGLGGSSALQGVIAGGNPMYGGYYVASMHELTHNYFSPYTLLDSNWFGPHWGLAGFDGVGGMLGGYARSAITCASPAGRVPTPSSPCDSGTVYIDNSKGAVQTSNDMSNTAFPAVEKYLMGLLSADELRANGGLVSYCPIASVDSSTTYDSSTNVITANCINGGLKFYTMDDVISKFPRTGKEMTPGGTLRTAVVAVYASASDIPASASAFTPQEQWLNTYYTTTLPPVFATATGNTQTVNFLTSASDALTVVPAPSSPPPPVSPPSPLTPPTPLAPPSPAPPAPPPSLSPLPPGVAESPSPAPPPPVAPPTPVTASSPSPAPPTIATSPSPAPPLESPRPPPSAAPLSPPPASIEAVPLPVASSGTSPALVGVIAAVLLVLAVVAGVYCSKRRPSSTADERTALKQRLSHPEAYTGKV